MESFLREGRTVFLPGHTLKTGTKIMSVRAGRAIPGGSSFDRWRLSPREGISVMPEVTGGTGDPVSVSLTMPASTICQEG